MKIFENNFQVVSTDYTSYAITYTCTHKTAMFDRDNISVLVRQPPGIEQPSQATMQKIRDEFSRIFGRGVEKPVVKVEGAGEQQEGQASAGEQPVDTKEAGVEVERAEGPKTGEEPSLENAAVLNLDTDLIVDSHTNCNKPDSYPDLSLSLVQRNKLREEQRRGEEKVTKP